MKDCNIYCVEFLGNDNRWHFETAWHTSKQYCENYIANAVDPSHLKITTSTLFID